MTNYEQSSADSLLKETPKVTNSVLGGTEDKVAEGSDNIYIDLDTLLDTRLGTLAGLGEEHAIRVLNSSKYHKRHTDIFDGVPNAVFREAYAARDMDTLRRSVLTNMVFFIRRMVKDSLMAAAIHERVEKMCFTVNVFPYDFNDQGLIDMLVGCIRFHTYSTASVRIISMSNAELTPQHCNSHYQIMIRYDWVYWANEHKSFFEKSGIPGVTIVVPELFLDEAPDPDEINRLGLRHVNPFEEATRITAAMFRLKHMPVSLYSIHERLTKENAAAQMDRIAVTQEDIEAYLNKSHPKATLIRDDPLPDVNLDNAFQLL